MKSFPKFLVLASLLLATAAYPSPSFAATAAADASPAGSPAAKKAGKFPFHGKLESVDAFAMTFTLTGTTQRVFNVTATTKIMKNGQPATLKDAATGDDVGGMTSRDTDGKLTALSVRFGPRPSPTPRAKRMKASPSPSPSPAAQ